MILSVIIPVHNTSQYISECLDSVLSQGVDDLEIIAINDCSQDNSLSILKQYARKDNRIRVVNLRKNIGLGPVRNKGIKLAKGELVAFLDSDDLMQPDSLGELITTAKDHNAQVVIGTVSRRFDRADGSYDIGEYGNSNHFNTVIFDTNIGKFPDLINIPPCWSILYKSSFLKSMNLMFRRKFQEDHDFVLNVFLEAKKVCIRGDVPYIYYRERYIGTGTSSSITQRAWSPERVGMMVDHLSTVVDLLLDKKHARGLGKQAYFLRNKRFSFYLGLVTNAILPKILSGEIKEYKNHLEKLSTIFEATNLREDCLDPSAETLATNEALVKCGYYDLALNLILDQRWNNLESLLLRKAFDLNTVAKMTSDHELHPKTTRSLKAFIQKQKGSIVSVDSFPPRLIPPTIEEVFIHIGTTKTGSTALQNFFDANQKKLKHVKILYPQTGLFYEKRKDSTRTAGHQEVIPATGQIDRDFFSRFYSEIELSHPVQKVLISAENMFHNMRAEKHIQNLRDSLGGTNVKIIVYLRRQDHWLESIYAEEICGTHAKETVQFNQFAVSRKDLNHLNYAKIIDTWAEVFGRENIIVRPYDKKIMQGGVINDFCEIANIGAVGGYKQISSKSSNISPLSKDDIVLLRQLNNLPVKSKDYGYRPFVHAFVDKFGSNANPRGISWFKGDERRKLLEECEESNRLISEKYLDGKPLFSSLTKQELKADLVNDNENIAIPAEKLEIALKLYHQFHDKEDPQKSTAKKPPATEQGYAYCYRQGTLCFHKGQFEAAFDFYSKALEQQPENVQLKRVLAESLINLDRKNEAVYHLEKAHKLLPDNKSIKRRLMKIKKPLLFYFQKSKPFPVP